MRRHQPVLDRITRSARRPLFLGSVGLAVAIVTVPTGFRSPATMQGGTVAQVVNDTDGDGLADLDELLLNTAPYLADTDGDSFSDAEELARDSDPADPWSQPASVATSTGLDVTARGGLLHLIQTHYLPDGSLQGVSVSLGGLLWGKLRFLSPLAWAANSKVSILPGAEPGSSVLVVDTKMRTRTVHTVGFVPFVAQLQQAGSVVSADVAEIESLGGFLVRRLQISSGTLNGFQSQGGGIQTAQAGGSASQFGLQTIYQPIGEGIGMNWIPGQICVQTMQTVGSVGAVLTQEVVSASCESGWEGACSPTDCAGTVGGTRETVDPGVLAGGG